MLTALLFPDIRRFINVVLGPSGKRQSNKQGVSILYSVLSSAAVARGLILCAIFPTLRSKLGDSTRNALKMEGPQMVITPLWT
jgi:hypothetical protein